MPRKTGTTTPTTFARYGLTWGVGQSDLEIEFWMIKHGGRYKVPGPKGKVFGNGLEFHFKAAIKLLWPEIVFHDWNERFIRAYLNHRTIVAIGPASSGKTHSAAICALTDYYVHAFTTTVICCSTTRERLEDRIWGELKKYHGDAKKRWPDLPGSLIEGRQRIITQAAEEAKDGRDFRNGLIGVPCKKGNDYVGLGDFAGIKNKRVRLLGDELSLLPRVFVDSISNLDKNPDFKAVGLGNPKETTDALGVLAEPAAELGGWDSGIDQAPGTKEWKIKRPDGICLQFPGDSSPNLDGKLGIPLITKEQIDRDVSFYGKDSLWYTMFCQGAMPRGLGSRRVLTRNLCLKNHAMEEPVWSSAERIRIGCLDAAYRGVGGDRCIFGELQVGYEVTPQEELTASAIINQNAAADPKRQVIALIDMVVVPIVANQAVIKQEEAEDQIVKFCMAQCIQRNIPPQHFFFDAGMRTTLVRSFAQWSDQVNPIDFGGSASERKVSENIDVLCKDHYSKFVTELWYTVRYIVEAGQFRGMTEAVMEEGCMREWTMVGGNKIEVEPKEKMKLKTGRSPDLFDCLCAGVEGARRLGFKIKKLAPPKREKVDTSWRRDLAEQCKKLWHGSALSYK